MTMWKVPFRDVYERSLLACARRALWCHVVMRVFPGARDTGVAPEMTHDAAPTDGPSLPVQDPPNRVGDKWRDPDGYKWTVYSVSKNGKLLGLQRRAPGIPRLCHTLAWSLPHAVRWKRVECAPDNGSSAATGAGR